MAPARGEGPGWPSGSTELLGEVSLLRAREGTREIWKLGVEPRTATGGESRTFQCEVAQRGETYWAGSRGQVRAKGRVWHGDPLMLFTSWAQGFGLA